MFLSKLKKTLAVGLIMTMVLSAGGGSAFAAMSSKSETVYKAGSAETLNSHVEALSEGIGVRLMGTPNEKAAAEYIKEQLDGMGYEAQIQEYQLPESKATTVAYLKADGKEYYGNYYFNEPVEAVTNPEFKDFTDNNPENTEIISQWAIDENDIVLVNNSLFSKLAELDSAKTTLDPTYTALSAADFMNQAVDKAEAEKAAMLIVYNDTGNRSLSIRNLNDNNIPVLAFNVTAGELLKTGQVEEIGTVERSISWNVCAVKEAGTEEPSAIIHVTGHLDSVMGSPGATDNASAVAALLELASLYKDVDTGGVEIRFAAVGGEEGGLNGSKAYVDTLTEEEIAISINFNMDMLSTSWEDADAVSLDIAPGMGGVFNIAAALIVTGANDLDWIEGTENVRWFQYGASDHESFCDKGIDAASMIRTTDETDDIEPVNHTADDSMAKNYSIERLVECTNMMSKGIAMAIDNKLTKSVEFYYEEGSSKIAAANAKDLSYLYDEITYVFEYADGNTCESVGFASNDYAVLAPEGATLTAAYATGEGTANVKGTFDRPITEKYSTSMALKEVQKPEESENPATDQAEDKEQVTEPAKDNEQPTKQSHNDNKSQPEGNSQVVKEPSSEGKLPMTGDNSLITTWIVIMLIAVSGAFAVHAKVKKVNNSDLFIK